MIRNKNILILEDNLKVLSLLLSKLADLEEQMPCTLSIMVLTNSLQVEQFINSNKTVHFDAILLDKNCKFKGSFHILDLERLGAEKVIAISTVDEYNQEVKARGVNRAVRKDYSNLQKFSYDVVSELRELLENGK